ncbi:ribbon-helix-helix protein, CopG family [Deinococcus sp. QL22]
MKEQRVNIRLDSKLLEELKAYAAANDKAYSMVIREAVRQHIRGGKQ